MLIGYMRVSSDNDRQTTDLQRDALIQAGVDERHLFEDKATGARDVRTFCNVLYYSGCRLSEALALTPEAFDYSGRLVVFETLKRRRKGVYRAVPVSYDMLDLLHFTHGLKDTIRRGKRAETTAPVWPWERTTAWRKVKAVMIAAHIGDGYVVTG